MDNNSNSKSNSYALSPHNCVVELGHKIGYFQVSAIVGNNLVVREYRAKTKAEAAKRFCNEINK